MMNKELFYTESLNVAAWLMHSNIELVQNVKVGNQTIFYFKRCPELKEAMDKYNNNPDLKGFIACFRKVKALTRG